MKKIIKKITVIILLIIMLACNFSFCHATEINNQQYVLKIRYSDPVLKYATSELKNSYTFYIKDGNEYPAYCLNKIAPGVGEYRAGTEYKVTPKRIENDAKIWRVFTNGYPYKTPEEMECETKEEAYTATLQAIYCIKYDYAINDFKNYHPINESGERVLNALKKLVKFANDDNNVKYSSIIYVGAVNNKWEIDKIDNNFISQEYKVENNGLQENFRVRLGANEISGIKVTDLNNEEKDVFNKDENFKVLLPIDQIEVAGQFYINVFGKIKSMPIYDAYHKETRYQNYGLTHGMYEEGQGSLLVKYQKGESQVTIIKRDNETKKRLSNAAFNILDESQKVVYMDLITNENGEVKVEKVNPGKYYLQETYAPTGYQKVKDLIPFTVKYNQELTINVNNSEITGDKSESSKGTINVSTKYEENTTIKDNTTEDIIISDRTDINKTTETVNKNESTVNKNENTISKSENTTNRSENIKNNIEYKQENINSISQKNKNIKVLPKTGM